MLLIKKVRLSYPSLFKATGFEGQEPKFSATFLIEKGSSVQEQIEAEINSVAEETFGKGYAAILKKQNTSQRQLLKDGDEKLNKDGEQADGYANMVYIKGSNKQKPKVVDRDRTELQETDGKPYGGCYVNAQIDIWPQNNKFGKFINVKLLAVQFWEDGDSFGAASVADVDAFESADVMSDDEEW